LVSNLTTHIPLLFAFPLSDPFHRNRPRYNTKQR
jgi:hypothetical protein